MPTTTNRRRSPLAAAVFLGGALLCFASEEPAPPPALLASCRPAHVEPPPPALTTAELELARYLSHRFQVRLAGTEQVVQAAYAASREVGLDPLLLLAVAAVESSFNPLAESVMGAKGLMQIIPKYHREKLRLAGGERALFDPEANILVGARILREYVYRTGTLQAGLQFYNGAFFDASARYARKVMAERARLEAVLHATKPVQDPVREAVLSADAS